MSSALPSIPRPRRRRAGSESRYARPDPAAFGPAKTGARRRSPARPHQKEVWNQFLGLDLAPGESFTFDLFTFYPISGSAPDGYVLTNNAGITVVPNDETRGRVVQESIEHQWLIRVDASVEPTNHLPYPPPHLEHPEHPHVPDTGSTLAMLGMALCTLGGIARRVKA